MARNAVLVPAALIGLAVCTMSANSFRAVAVEAKAAAKPAFTHVVVFYLTKDAPKEEADALIAALRRARKPVVAAVNGVAVGAGAVIALACDLRIASESAKFGFIFPKVGLCGADMGATYLLPRIVGLGRATELLFLGDVLGAEEAERIGLFGRVVAPEECVKVALALAERLASGPAFAHAMTKQMLESEHGMTLDQAIEAEAQVQAICMQHPDFRAAYDAWVDKRPIVFAGASGPFNDGRAKK